MDRDPVQAGRRREGARGAKSGWYQLIAKCSKVNEAREHVQRQAACRGSMTNEASLAHESRSRWPPSIHGIHARVGCNAARCGTARAPGGLSLSLGDAWCTLRPCVLMCSRIYLTLRPCGLLRDCNLCVGLQHTGSSGTLRFSTRRCRLRHMRALPAQHSGCPTHASHRSPHTRYETSD